MRPVYVYATLILVTLTGSFCLPDAAHGQNNQKAGAGASTCGEFGQYYRKQPDFFEAIYFSWAQGYMSGFNAHRQAQGKPMFDLLPPNMKSKEQESFIRDYCDTHPLAPYSQAVISLYLEISKHNRERK